MCSGFRDLKTLLLQGNQLTSLPPELGKGRCLLCVLEIDLQPSGFTVPSSHKCIEHVHEVVSSGCFVNYSKVSCVCLLKGELRQLRGLGLAGNPLSCPPTAMVRRGTSAVLRYLRGQLRARRSGERREMGNGGEGERGSVESGTESGEKDYFRTLVMS